MVCPRQYLFDLEIPQPKNANVANRDRSTFKLRSHVTSHAAQHEARAAPLTAEPGSILLLVSYFAFGLRMQIASQAESLDVPGACAKMQNSQTAIDRHV